jgi:replicative DNA helicase
MIDPDAFPKVSPILKPEHFYSEAHRRIYEACESLSEGGKPIDVVQVATWLKGHDRIGQIGGMAYLTEVLNTAPAVANVVSYAEIVASKARVRKLVQICQRITSEGYQPMEDEDAFIDRAETAVHQVSADKRRLSVETMRSALQKVFKQIQESDQRREQKYSGTPTGLTVLDDHIGGLHAGEQTVIAARPGIGKSALMMSIASKVADQDLGVIVFSLEMPSEQLAIRALCSAANVDVRKARVGAFDAGDLRAITDAIGPAIRPEHYYLVETPCTLMDVRGIVRARQADMARTGTKLGLVAVDYAQLMDAREGVKNREEAVAINARGLKMLAKEVGAAVVLLSQLNRGVESRADKRPMLSDLRESGAIEEAADCVIGMYRDDYYYEDSKTPGIVELILLKHRHGPTGTIEVGFRAQSTSFYNIESTY